MRDNINKVSQRGERLDSLQDKTDNLAVSAQGFRRGANRVRKQMWWKVSLQFEGLFIFLAQLTFLGYEDAHVHNSWHNSFAYCHYCTIW